MFTIYAQRYHAYEPFVLAKDIKDVGKAGDVIDDGQPKKITVARWADERLANNMADNIKENMPKRMWKITVETD